MDGIKYSLSVVKGFKGGYTGVKLMQAHGPHIKVDSRGFCVRYIDGLRYVLSMLAWWIPSTDEDVFEDYFMKLHWVNDETEDDLVYIPFHYSDDPLGYNS